MGRPGASRSHRCGVKRVGLTLAVALLASAARPSEVDVILHEGRMDLKAREAPLSEVLGRVTEAIGAEVEYKGPQPEQAVTLTLLDQTPLDALVGVLVDQGADFALQMDAEGTGVVKVVVATDTSVAEDHRPAPTAAHAQQPEEARGAEALQRLMDRLGVVPQELEAVAAELEEGEEEDP